MTGNNTVKSVVKAMKIFEVLVDKGNYISLSNLSKKVNINISTVHRLLNTLLQLGYVEQNEKGYYGLGIKSYKLADIISDNFDLKKIIRPYLKEIVAKCNETSNLVILEDNKAVYIDQVESTNMVRMFASVNSKGEAYCTGSGKALLAYQDSQEIERYIKTTEFKAFTKNTITDPEKFKKELQKIKKKGYALDLEEKERGVRCVAAPIFDRKNEIIAAIGVSGPCTRLTMDYLENNLIPLITETAEKINKYF